MKIGFIGFGEAAFNLACGFSSEGLSDIIAYDSMESDFTLGKLIQSRALEANVTLISDVMQLVQSVDIIVAAVPSSFTLDVCSKVKKHLHSNQIYADVSASTSTAKMKIWDNIKDTGVLFVDAAMMGSLPKDKHKVPIMASGNGAERFKELMTPYNMKITTAGDRAGDASAIKLIRSIYMKGIASLMIEMLQAADAYDVTDEVISSISESMDNTPFISHLDRLVIGSAIHCKRRADELVGSIAMLEEAMLDSSMTHSAKHRLQALEKYEFAKRYIEEKPSSWQEIIDSLRVKKVEVL